MSLALAVGPAAGLSEAAKGGGGGGQTGGPAKMTYSGQATGARVNVPLLGINTAVSDTGPLPSSGGALEASLVEAQVPGVLSAGVLHASTVGQGNESRSEASVADATVTLGGNIISAGFLMSRATASCSGGQASVTAGARRSHGS